MYESVYIQSAHTAACLKKETVERERNIKKNTNITACSSTVYTTNLCLITNIKPLPSTLPYIPFVAAKEKIIYCNLVINYLLYAI